MTGRELIIYILENKLEDEQVFKDGKLIGFTTEEETAVAFGVGLATIRAWIKNGMIQSIKIGNMIYIPKNAQVNLYSNGKE